MIIDRKFAVLEEKEGNFEGVDATLSLDDLDLIFSFVSENFYSDIEGSIVRELTSNCVDSHTEAKISDPIVIEYSDIEGTNYISFIDVGTGLSPNKFKNIYMKYFKSTKRESNEFVGFFGIGSKSPLGYTDSFEVITRSEGVEYHYVVGKSESGKPRADLLNVKDTTERNGTEVKIVINPSDYYKFEEAIKKQLIYFDNVFVSGFNVDNSFNIIESDTFKFRHSINSENPYDEMHIAFGRVVYPINWTALSRRKIEFPVGVKFDIGELQVTKNREQIIYSDEAKELINQRIDLTLQKIKEIYNEQNSQDLSLKEYLKVRLSPVKKVRLGIAEVKLPTKPEPEKNREWILKEVDLIEGLMVGGYKNFVNTPLELPDNVLFEYEILDVITRNNISKRDRSQFKSPIKTINSLEILGAKEKENIVYYYLDKKSKNKKIDTYLLEKETENPYVRIAVLRKRKKLSLHAYNEYLNLNGTTKEIERERKRRDTYNRTVNENFNGYLEGSKISSIPFITDKWNKTKLIKLYQKIIKEELDNVVKSYDAIEDSFDFALHLESLKKKRVIVKQEGTINAYCMYNSEEIKLDLKSLNNFKGIILYSFRGDAKRLRPLFDALSNSFPSHTNKSKAIKGYMVGKTFFKHFNSPYFMSVDEFLSNGNSIMQKMITAHIVDKRYRKVKDVTGYLSGKLHEFSPEIAEKESRLIEFMGKYYRGINILQRETPELLDEMVNIVVSNNWVIPHYIQELEPIEKFYQELELFQYLEIEAFRDKIGKERIIEYLKLKKKKLDAIYYFIPTPEEEKILEYAVQLENYKNQLQNMYIRPYMRNDRYANITDSPYFN